MSKTQRASGRHREEVVTERIVETVASARNVDPVELPPLYTAIDPDALNALFHADGRASKYPDRLEFVYDEHTVIVHGDASVSIDDQSFPAEDASIPVDEGSEDH